MTDYTAISSDLDALRAMAEDYAQADPNSPAGRQNVMAAARPRMNLIAKGTVLNIHHQASALQTWCMIQIANWPRHE